MYNGEKYLEKALDSLLNQTYTNLEIIISDNASIDNTQNICKKYVKMDERIHYHRNKENIGAAENFNKVVTLSSGKYFKWAHHDDFHAIDYIEKCVNILENNDDVMLCHSYNNIVDSEGVITEVVECSGSFNFDLPSSRLKYIMFNNESWMFIHGLIRANTLKKTNLLGSFLNADRVLLAEITLKGKFIQLEEYLFNRRSHLEAYTETAASLEDKINWWNPSNEEKKQLPFIKLYKEYNKVISSIDLPTKEKIKIKIMNYTWLIFMGVPYTIYSIIYFTLRGTIAGKLLKKILDFISNCINMITGKNKIKNEAGVYE